MKDLLLSIVIPLFNEEENIGPLYEELLQILPKLNVFSTYEIVFVNDGSKDTSLDIVKKLAHQNTHVKVLSFTRNFGHESATYAGIINATGDAVVLMDADRQDPPTLIFEFEKAYQEGIDIAYGQRTKRLQESWVKKCTSKMFYPLFKFITNIDMPRDVGDFCLLSRKAVDMIKQLPERALFVRGLIYWLGLPKRAIPFVRRERGAGTTKYNYRKLTIFALENIISFSTVPIYWLLFFSLGIITLCGGGIVVALIMRLCGYVVMSGWTSLMMCMLFLSATILFALSIIGLYIGKIFQEIKERPIFLVDEKINFN
ncbi:MAG: Glycosyl transferase family 2 [candidate division TM6 bacterium GW2011_GWF2_38_10]|nr:MAG: Glycosyl transferase family 2 [candidate division TM6 bacterium GW2011_GWF2_38_10]